MKFDWDPEKAKANFAKHGVAFDVAMRVFDDPRSVTVFDRTVAGEERWRTVGRVGVATILFVAHTWLDEDGELYVRIISARRADRLEIRAYERGDEGHFR
ncbi:BrnT family toxin [Brevundimonas subvibrioides]|uniref:BrnT family toxin n=1 Tax=Brevundimonas subvibrioides TaxID=74313 RepID=UPI0022B4D6FE|nr:BrnT family toxin [Brevundimonas subvibrioides]